MNLFLNARDSVFLPEYDAGFWVAKILKFLWGLIWVCCSGMNNYLLSSNSLFKHYNIYVLAKFNSSNISQCPYLTACTSGPSLNISLPSLSGK